jgi:TolB-like protein
MVLAVVVAGALAYFGINKFWFSKYQASPPTPPAAPASAAPAAFAPPPHSIAVLPFVNMSGDKEQEYFSDGLTEELLDSLSRINELQVAARTSAFSFKGKDTDISTIARKLNVAAVLEGSVRRSAHTVRVTTQLINAVTGFHVWSHTYDRDLGDILKLQTDIGTAIASALKVTLLGDVAAKIELGGTRNPAAFDAYLRASKAYWSYQNRDDVQSAIAGYTEAIRLDPDYALAYADRSIAQSVFANTWAQAPPAVRDYMNKAQGDARQAIALARELANGHLALASVLENSLEFLGASEEFERALALAPGNARVLRNYGLFAVRMGRTEAGLKAAQRSVVLDPLNSNNHFSLGESLLIARRYNESIRTFTAAKVLAPDDAFINGWLGFAYYLSGDYQSARTACEGPGHEINKQFCWALLFAKLGRRADAETALAKVRAMWGEHSAMYAMVYAQWGDATRALDSLEAAMRRREPDLEKVKMSPWYDPLRKEPRFQTIERALKFPN